MRKRSGRHLRRFRADARLSIRCVHSCDQRLDFALHARDVILLRIYVGFLSLAVDDYFSGPSSTDEEWKMNDSGNGDESDDDPTALDSRLALGESEEDEAAAVAATRLSDTDSDSEPGGGPWAPPALRGATLTAPAGTQATYASLVSCSAPNDQQAKVSTTNRL